MQDMCRKTGSAAECELTSRGVNRFILPNWMFLSVVSCSSLIFVNIFAFLSNICSNVTFCAH